MSAAPDEDAPSWLLMPEDAILALGKLTVSYSVLELMMHQFIWKLAGSNFQIGSVLTSRLDAPQLRERLSALYRYLPYQRAGSPEQVRLAELLDRIEKLASQRNDLVHSFWIGSPGAVQPNRLRYKVTMKHGLDWRLSGIVPAAEIERLVSEIEAARRDLMQLFFQTLPQVDLPPPESEE